MCEGGIKTNLRPQDINRAKTAPPGFEIPGSATDNEKKNAFSPTGQIRVQNSQAVIKIDNQVQHMPEIPKEIFNKLSKVITSYIYDQYDHVLLLAQKLLLQR